MRAIRARREWLAIALTLAIGCGRAHEPAVLKVAGCGRVIEIVEVDRHLYGWTEKPYDPEPRTPACVFDIGARGERLRVDQVEGPGVLADVLVAPNGSQTLAMQESDQPLFVRLLRRDADGISELSELRGDWQTGWIKLVGSTRGLALIAFAYEDSGGCWSDRCLRAWQPLETSADTLAPPLEDTLALPLENHAHLFNAAGTIVAVAIADEVPVRYHWYGFGRSVPIGSVFTVSVLEELAKADDSVRWTRRMPMPNDSNRGSRLVDVASTGERVFILAQEAATNAHWLACLATADGELLWTAPIESGELNLRGLDLVSTGMRASKDGVVVAIYGVEYGLLGTSSTFVTSVAVSAAGEQSLLGKRKVTVPSVDAVEPAADGGVWLAGYDNGAWVTWVDLGAS